MSRSRFHVLGHAAGLLNEHHAKAVTYLFDDTRMGATAGTFPAFFNGL